MEMLQMLLEDTKKNTLIGECQIVVLYFLLTRNISQKAMGMLSMCVIYVIYGWKSRSSRVSKDSRPSVPDVLQLVEVPPRLLYTVH
jgi:hypothetical protein